MRLIFTIIFVLIFPQLSHAQDAICDVTGVNLPLGSRVASAGTFANLRGSSDSLKVQAEEILRDSLEKSNTITTPPNTCKAKCELNSGERVVFSAVPSKLLNDYSDKEKCDAYYKDTLAKPLTWKGLSFKDAKEISENFGQLSQGKGEIGAELYKKCDGDCSPQYEIDISPKPDKTLKVDISAVCGPARDKDEGTYKLATKLFWECSK
jgi:hypothetical protein